MEWLGVYNFRSSFSVAGIKIPCIHVGGPWVVYMRIPIFFAVFSRLFKTHLGALLFPVLVNRAINGCVFFERCSTCGEGSIFSALVCHAYYVPYCLPKWPRPVATSHRFSVAPKIMKSQLFFRQIILLYVLNKRTDSAYGSTPVEHSGKPECNLRPLRSTFASIPSPARLNI